MVLNAISGLGFTFIANGMIAMFRRSLLVLFYRLLINSKVVWMLFQNPDDRDLFEQYGITYQGHAREIKGSGVDLTQFLPTPLPVGTPKVVLIARMLWDKGVGEFVESAKLIKQRGIEVQFLLVGSIDEGNPKSIPVEQLGEWTRSGQVDWLGSRSDIPQLLEESRIVVLPSYREGLPKTLIEAASAGRPIVTTDVPGCREVVQHGKNGILVSIRNAEQLADAIEKLIRDPELCRIMGRNGRQIAEQKFSVQRVVDETLDLYSELLS
jgi:glycosyltransferase involved in cell wall biosynthesis